GLRLQHLGRRLSQISCRDSPYFVTELIRIDVRSIKYGALDETGIASAVTRPGLDQPVVLVVGDADAGERREHRRVVSALAAASYRQFDHRTRARHHADAERGLCVRLCLPFVSSACRRA